MGIKSIVAKDVLYVLNNIKTDNQSDYKVWYKGKTFSPALIISKCLHNIGSPLKRKDYTTDIAQRHLLKLGFPIIDSRTDFFSEKELTSFEYFVKRAYDSKGNDVDKNISLFIKEMLWNKSKKWADLSKLEVGWKVEGSKNWNVQKKNTTGQGYRHYTWYKIIPKDAKQKLLFFTVGVGVEEGVAQLIYKLDINNKDDFFFQELEDWFYKETKRLQANWKVIEKADLINYDWNRLKEETTTFFKKHLDDYFRIEKKILENKRIMRLTWNENNWEFPSGNIWSKKNQEKESNFADKYGFAYEEWLFNSRYTSDRFQYGYLQGANTPNADVTFLDEVILFTIHPKTNKRLLVGSIKNVEIITHNKKIIEDITPLFDSYSNDALEELALIEADITHFNKEPLLPNVRFKMENVNYLDDFIELTSETFSKYNRFTGYKFIDEGGLIENKEEILDGKFKFDSGKGKNQSDYEKSGKTSKPTKVIPLHSKISDALYAYLKTKKEIKVNQLSFEKTRIDSSIADGVIEVDNEYTILEIKTSSQIKRNIRDAIGQLLEYSLLDSSIKIKKIIIVSPAQLNKKYLLYLKRIQKIIDLRLEYWAYDLNTKSFKETKCYEE